MKKLLSCIAVLALLASSALFAKESVKADPRTFAASRMEIERGLADGERYSELTRTKREEVRAALNRMEAILATAESVTKLPDEQKIQLMNDQELVNTILTKAREDSRLICTSERKTGSHMNRPKCQTVAEARHERESSQGALRDHQRIKWPCRETKGCLGGNGKPVF